MRSACIFVSSTICLLPEWSKVMFAQSLLWALLCMQCMLARKKKGDAKTQTSVWNAGNLTVGILAAHSSQVIACQEAWTNLVELLPQAARASFELCTLSIATSPGIQGKTLMHRVLCMPFNCADWTQFRLSPHRLCNFVSRYFHGLRFLQCHGQV